MEATEEERQRRIQESYLEETNERQKRQAWSRKATAAEQERILREKAISSMEDTPWFQKMITSYNDDYIVMCPSSKPSIIQQSHITIGQLLCLIIEDYFFSN